MPRRVLISVRRDSAANWVSVNPVLADGEFGYEIESSKAKIGDGVTAWSSLRYLPDVLHDNVVGNRVIRDSAGVSVIGRASDTLGNPADIIAPTDEFILRRTGNELGFGVLTTNHFADGAVTAGKIVDGTIDDDEISVNAEINPGKLGPGSLPIYTTVTTPNYVDRSITVDKLNKDISDDGVGVWQPYPLKMYVIYPRYFYGYRWSGLPWWGPFLGIYRLRRPYRYFLAPLPDLDEAREHGGVEVLHAKYCIINNTCFVNALVRITNARRFQSVVFFNLPKDPICPDNTTIGDGYHLNSKDPRNMPALRAIKLENEAVGFLGYRYRRDRWWWWDEAYTSYYHGVFQFPDRISFNLRYEISPLPLQDGLVPTFDTPVRTEDGFTVNITNYDPEFNYVGYAPDWRYGRRRWFWYRRRFWKNREIFADVEFGTPSGNILPITVRGIRWRQRIVLVVSTIREGYNDGIGWVSGRADYPYWWWGYWRYW